MTSNVTIMCYRTERMKSWKRNSISRKIRKAHEPRESENPATYRNVFKPAKSPDDSKYIRERQALQSRAPNSIPVNSIWIGAPFYNEEISELADRETEHKRHHRQRDK